MQKIKITSFFLNYPKIIYLRTGMYHILFTANKYKYKKHHKSVKYHSREQIILSTNKIRMQQGKTNEMKFKVKKCSSK